MLYKNHPFQRARLGSRRGYAMLVAVVIVAILTVAGTTTLNVAGIDQQIASRNRQHMLIFNTSDAGTIHARDKIKVTKPDNEGVSVNGLEDTAGYYVQQTAAETSFGGLAYTHNLGVYYVEALYQRCGNPPPRYSTEQGNNGFRADYWEMRSVGRLTDSSYTNINATEAVTSSLIRMVVRGPCKVR